MVAQLSLLPVTTPKKDGEPTFGEQVAEMCRLAAAEHRKRGIPLQWSEVAEIIDAADAARPAKRRRENGRDLLFDAIAEACGIDLRNPLTRGGASAIGTAKRDILEASPNVTPDDIHRRKRAYLAKFPGISCTPSGLAKHWAEFPPPKAKEKYPPGPAGWLARLNEKYPDSTLARGGVFEITEETGYAWAQLDPTLRKELA